MKAKELRPGSRVLLNSLSPHGGCYGNIVARLPRSGKLGNLWEVRLDGGVGVYAVPPEHLGVVGIRESGKLKSGIPGEAGVVAGDVPRPIMDDDDAHNATVQKLDKRVSELTEELDKKDQAIRRHLDIAASLRERIEELNAALVSAIDEIVTLNRALRNTVQKVDNETQDQS